MFISLIAPVVEGVEYGGKLPSFGGIWINFREPLDNFLGTPDQFVVRGCQFWRRGESSAFVLLLGAPYLVLEVADIAVGPQLDFVPADCLNDLFAHRR